MKLRLISCALLLGCRATVTSAPPAQPTPPPPPPGGVTVTTTTPTPPPPETPPPPPVTEPAPAPGAHPAYIMALRNLRFARALLERPARPDVKWDEQAAIHYIDGAMKEIRDAAIDDGKPMTDHPVLEATWGYRDRLHRSMLLLRDSMHDLMSREDNGFARGLRNRAINQISQAEHAVAAAIGEHGEEIKLDQAEKKEAAAEHKEMQAEKKEAAAEHKEMQAEHKEMQAEHKEMQAEKKEMKAEKKEMQADKKDAAADKAVATDKKQVQADKKKLKKDEKKEQADKAKDPK